MILLCRIGRHSAAPGSRYNHGLTFSRCRRCGADLVRSDRDWELVPKGFRVVWKPVVRPAQVGLPMVRIRPGTAMVRRNPAVEWSYLVLTGLALLCGYAGERFRRWRRGPAARRAGRSVKRLMAPTG